jgi:hypothetical protein
LFSAFLSRLGVNMLNLLGAFFLSATMNGKPVWLGDMSCFPDRRCDGVFEFSSRKDCQKAAMLISGLLGAPSRVSCSNSDGIETDIWEQGKSP